MDLEPIAKDRRREERKLKLEYAERRPRILGAVLDLLAAVMRELPAVQLSEMPRMADFAGVLAAMDKVCGTNSLRSYLAQQGRIAIDVVASDPVGAALVAFIEEHGEWSGTATELLDRLTPQKRPANWPNTGRGMAGRLRRLIPALAQSGIETVLPAETDKTRRYVVRTIARTAQSPESGPDDAASDDQGEAVERAQQPNRPDNRPTKIVSPGGEKAQNGRTGDPGDSLRLLSERGACATCGRLDLWWQFAGQQDWTCGLCHPPLEPEAVQWRNPSGRQQAGLPDVANGQQ